MFVIFGWGHQKIKHVGVIPAPAPCGNCHNEGQWLNLIDVSTWFTLFFIPVIPYERKRFLLCPVCQHGLELDRAEFTRLRPLAELGLLFAEGKITDEEYVSMLGDGSKATLEPWDGEE